MAVRIQSQRTRRAWTAFETMWKHCRKCPLHETAANHVLTRGTLPCDVLFIGEAPGPTEDALGEPFVGKSGKLLDLLIDKALTKIKAKLDIAFTNTVCCFPAVDMTEGQDDEWGHSWRQPDKSEVAACSPRLEQFLSFALKERSGIVAVGKVAQKTMFKASGVYHQLAEGIYDGSIKPLEIQHPSFMLRNGGEGSEPFKKAYLQLVQFFSHFVERKSHVKRNRARR